MNRLRHGAGLLAILAALAASASALTACSSNGGGRTSSSESRALLDASQCAVNRSAGTVTYVSPFGFDASAGIIDVFAAQKLGYFRAMCLQVELVTNSQDSTELVSSGRATVSNIGSAADDLGEVAEGANVVAVATFGDTSDYALLTQPQITSLRQLVGKTLGYHFTVPLMILEMLRAAGVEPSQVDMVGTQDYDPNQLVQGKESALQAYQSNEPLTLEAEGARFNEYVPSRFGIRGTFNVEIFNRPFLIRHGQAATDFLRAELHAFDYCVAHEVECVRIEQSYAQASGSVYPFSHELSVWHLEAALAETHRLPGRGVGVETQAEWEPEAQALRQYRILDSVPQLGKWENTSVAASLYDGTRLLWPEK